MGILMRTSTLLCGPHFTTTTERRIRYSSIVDRDKAPAACWLPFTVSVVEC